MELIKNNPETSVIILLAALALIFLWNIFLHFSLRKTRKKISAIFSGGKTKNLEGVVLEQARNLKALDKDIQELYNISNQINTLAFKSLHKTGMVRFNPFKEVGGNQSFSIALLNGKNNGIVISSLYTREGTRIYSKTITSGRSEKHPLTEEEQQAIKIAMVQESKKIS